MPKIEKSLKSFPHNAQLLKHQSVTILEVQIEQKTQRDPRENGGAWPGTKGEARNTAKPNVIARDTVAKPRDLSEINSQVSKVFSQAKKSEYIAICMPLRYHNLITIGTVIKFISIVWVADFVIIVSLFIWTMTKEICRTNIVDTYCNNPSLMKLICEDTSVLNYYGLFTANLVQIPSILIVSLTYIKILKTCHSTKQAQSNLAMQTSGTHLVVFLIFEVTASLLFISHRLEAVSPHLQRAFGISIVPPILNPLIYGLNTREIQQAIFKFFHKKISYI
ncbi:olfactory receptor 52L1-like [Hemibagrus wyckioides]|uniref:olfactory receptor 52L1-like n=1 Tax=Hemibagrus wyckioides TaxID=337641 RepID=UPI00266C8F66|nr:olfactory receptor 52L1-like [Hemibagrus wyckioides]